MMSEVSTIGHFKIEPVFLNGTLLELVLSFKCSPSQLVSKVKDTKVFATTSQLPSLRFHSYDAFVEAKCGNCDVAAKIFLLSVIL